MASWLLLPPWSLSLICLGLVGLLAGQMARAWRENRLVRLRRQWLTLALRAACIAALTVIALNPTAIRPRESAGKPSLVVLVDTSGSMATADVGGQSRLAVALEALRSPRIRQHLGEEFTLDVRTFDRESRPASLGSLTPDSAAGPHSRLGDALMQAVLDAAEQKDRAGVLVVSDGRATGGAPPIEAGRLALAKDVPLWTWTLGGEVPRRDLWIESAGSEVLTFSGADVELSLTLCQVGYDHRNFRVQLLADDVVVQELEATPGPDGSAPLAVTVKAPEAGESRLVFRVEAQADEADPQNNEQTVFLRTVGEKVRVLLAEGQPHWDTKFLVQSLKRDDRVDLTAVYRLSDSKQFAVLSREGQQTRTAGDLFPRTTEQFAQFDVIILGRGCEAFFDEDTESHLTAFVAEAGGGLVFSRGKSYGGRFQPLAKFEPVVWGESSRSGVRLAATTAALRSSVLELSPARQMDELLASLPRIDQVRQTVGVKPLAVILANDSDGGGLSAIAADGVGGAEGDSAVMMAYHRYGLGRVVTINAGGLWRWAFDGSLIEQETADQKVYDRFWLGLMRWLLSGSDFLAGHDVALRSDRRVYTDEQRPAVLVRTRGLDSEAYRPRLTVLDARTMSVCHQLQPRAQGDGAYLAEWGAMPPGQYVVRLDNNVGRPGELTTTFEVVGSSVESRVLSADERLMAQLADLSGGQAITQDELDVLGRLVRKWRAGQHLDESRAPLWAQWWLLALTTAVLAGEWLIRRREGLL